MTYSLRRVLAVRFSLTMLVALSFIALWALVGVERTLRGTKDRALTSALRLQQAVLAAGNSIPAQSEPADFHAYIDDTNRFIAARDSAGGITSANIAAARDLPLDTAALARARAGETAWITERWHDTWIRSVYGPVPPGSPASAAVVQVAASLDPLAHANRDMLFVLLGTVLLSALATAFGAFWLARSAVSPVLEVAEQARTFTPETRGQRITVHADVAEYESLVTVLNDLLDRNEQAFATQRRFIGDVGHELRTPLTALQGHIEVALRSERSPRDYQLVLAGALEEVEHLARMSESLLLITRAEGGDLTPNWAPTDLNHVTRDLLDRVHRRIEEKGLSVKTRLDYAGPPALLDDRLITRALRELVDNAVKFTPHGGRVAVGTAALANGVAW